MDMDDDFKQAMEMSMNEFVSGLEKGMPKEPNEGDPSAYKIAFRCESQTFSRIFASNDLIKDVKNFVQSKLRTFSDVEIFEAFPRKVFSNENVKIAESGISKNQMLNVKILY